MGTGSDKARTWYSLRVECDEELSDAIGSFLIDAGAPGIQTDGAGNATVLTAHVPDRATAGALEAHFDHLAEFFPGSTRPTLQVGEIDESDWAENWKDHFPPRGIGERLFVHPPWVTDIPSGRIAVELDPGMAFGTGHHASTRGCLAALDQCVDADAGPVLLDLGTGSGILAIAAIKLGAVSALAVDIDEEACAIARDNTVTNGVADRIEVTHQLDEDRTAFDIVVANIFSGMLIGFANDIARRLVAGGIAIGSGLESVESDGVEQAWQAAGLRRRQVIEIDGWSTLVFEKP